MIGWHIELGYCTGYTGKADWKTVVELAEAIALDSETLATEASLIAPHLHDQIVEVAATYQPDSNGRPLSMTDVQIMILASGGDLYRTAKEHTARAFVRLLMHAVHERGFDITVMVA